MQLTADETSVGLEADSVQVSVRMSDACLIGQYGPKSGECTSSSRLRSRRAPASSARPSLSRADPLRAPSRYPRTGPGHRLRRSLERYGGRRTASSGRGPPDPRDLPGPERGTENVRAVEDWKWLNTFTRWCAPARRSATS
ncbi:DUF6993 domain-containing protein [Rathayibacter oskolensis]|uniref:DUF6993 domain-containing protein n=1 Tax=Rathayibacter oskolensis TaxID=1891671 RepID=UPI003F5D55C4